MSPSPRRKKTSPKASKPPSRPAKGRRPAGAKRGKGDAAGQRRGSSEKDSPQRLQKVLAARGAGSRRQCEELILAGRVEVDRRVVTEMGTRVDPENQEIRLDGVVLARPKQVYYAVNKPDGVISTNRDPSGRPRVIDLLPSRDQRLFPVGRLDLHSEGLILMTNDGELANRLTHPRYEVRKTYRVMVAGHPGPEVLRELGRGVRLAEGVAKPVQVTVKSRYKKSTILEMVLDEGRNREIRRIMARVGHKVLRLVRVAVGPVRLGKLPPGEHRHLTGEELRRLRAAAKASGTNKLTVPRKR